MILSFLRNAWSELSMRVVKFVEYTWYFCRRASEFSTQLRSVENKKGQDFVFGDVKLHAQHVAISKILPAKRLMPPPKIRENAVEILRSLASMLILLTFISLVLNELFKVSTLGYPWVLSSLPTSPYQSSAGVGRGFKWSQVNIKIIRVELDIHFFHLIHFIHRAAFAEIWFL